MSRDALLYIADMVAAGDAVSRWVIDAEELCDVATQKVPEFVAELRPWLHAAN